MIRVRTIARKVWQSQGLRFIVVGIGNTVVSYCIYAGIVFIGWGFRWANLVALVIGIIFSFKSQGRLVFLKNDNRLFLRFLLSWVFIYVGTIAVIGHLVQSGINEYYAGLLALPFSATLSYLSQKYFVFR